MKKILFLLLSGTIFLFLSGCQRDSIDSLIHSDTDSELLFMQGNYEKAYNSYSQLWIARDSLELTEEYSVRILKRLGIIASNLGKYQEAISHLNMADSLAGAYLEKRDPELIDIRIWLASVKYDQGYGQLAKVMIDSILEEFKGERHYYLANAYDLLAFYLGERKQFDACKAKIIQAEKMRRNAPKIERYKDALHWGIYYRETGKYAKAMDAFERCEKWIQRYNVNPIKKSTLLQNKSLLKYHQQAYDEALIYLEQALSLLPEYVGSYSIHSVITLGDIADIHREKGEWDEAIEIYHRLIDLVKSNTPERHAVLSGLYQNLGATKLSVGEIDSTKIYYTKALTALDPLKPFDAYAKRYWYVIQFNLANLLLNVYPYQSEEAISKYSILIDSLTKDYGPNSLMLVPSLINKGLAYQDLEDYEQSDLIFQEGLDILDMKSRDTTDFPKCRNAAYALSALQNQAESHFLIAYRNKGDLELWLRANKDYKYVMDFIDYLRGQYNGEFARINLTGRYKMIFERSILINSELFKMTNDKIYQQNAFAAAEKSKALALLEHSRKNLADQNKSRKSSTIFTKERKLRSEVNQSELIYFQSLTVPAPDLSFEQKSRDALIKKREQLSKFLDKHRNKPGFKDYYHAIYEPENRPAKELQSLLKEQNSTLVEYFLGNQSDFAIVVTSDDIFVQELSFYTDELAAEIDSIHAYVSTYPSTNSLEKVESFVAAAKGAYDKVLKPIINRIETERVVIIPDEVLTTLPFEVLLDTIPKHLDNYQTLPYLVKKHTISYCFSANMLWEMQRAMNYPKKRRPFIGVAPNYNGEHLAIPDGSSNPKEKIILSQFVDNQIYAKNINNTLFKGISLLSNEATKQNFLKKGRDAKIIFLPVHGEIYQGDGDYSWLAFQPEGDFGSTFLTLKELYHWRTQTDLVAVPACKTANGTFMNGEGLISIGRGFAYAGAKSIVCSMWKSKESSTMKFFDVFFKRIVDEVPKDEALTIVKRDILNPRTRNDIDPHPYYWASFIAIGDMSPIVSN